MKYKNINEEINRMKSLFNNERLYGNLVDKNEEKNNLVLEWEFLSQFSPNNLLMEQPIKKFIKALDKTKTTKLSNFFKNRKATKKLGIDKYKIDNPEDLLTVLKSQDFVNALKTDGNRLWKQATKKQIEEFQSLMEIILEQPRKFVKRKVDSYDINFDEIKKLSPDGYKLYITLYKGNPPLFNLISDNFKKNAYTEDLIKHYNKLDDTSGLRPEFIEKQKKEIENIFKHHFKHKTLNKEGLKVTPKLINNFIVKTSEPFYIKANKEEIAKKIKPLFTNLNKDFTKTSKGVNYDTIYDNLINNGGILLVKEGKKIKLVDSIEKWVVKIDETTGKLKFDLEETKNLPKEYSKVAGKVTNENEIGILKYISTVPRSLFPKTSYVLINIPLKMLKKVLSTSIGNPKGLLDKIPDGGKYHSLFLNRELWKKIRNGVELNSLEGGLRILGEGTKLGREALIYSYIFANIIQYKEDELYNEKKFPLINPIKVFLRIEDYLSIIQKFLSGVWEGGVYGLDLACKKINCKDKKPEKCICNTLVNDIKNNIDKFSALVEKKEFITLKKELEKETPNMKILCDDKYTTLLTDIDTLNEFFIENKSKRLLKIMDMAFNQTPLENPFTNEKINKFKSDTEKYKELVEIHCTKNDNKHQQNFDNKKEQGDPTQVKDDEMAYSIDPVEVIDNPMITISHSLIPIST